MCLVLYYSHNVFAVNVLLILHIFCLHAIPFYIQKMCSSVSHNAVLLNRPHMLSVINETKSPRVIIST